ncbi:RsbR, positive regulator of sigma-B [Chondromyces apiculatus DSM 436]|uniref:RsbR, positive regulator of sigma-B n=2 Tax=Chondromyces apiculatus TaxID=51 RepID=A0A017T828_9BACT|nr:RsbR, positive regulator of sigma-B [Chondromyces apiculatus DSM 436]
MDVHDSVMGSFFETCPQMLFIAGLEGQLRITRQALRTAFGPGGEGGSTLADLVHPDDRSMFEAA